MRVLCSWCLEEGRTPEESFIRDKEPFEDASISHGICQDHADELYRQIIREPGGRRPNPSAALDQILGPEKARAVEVAFGGDIRNIFSSSEETLRRHMNKTQAAKVRLLGQAITDWYGKADEVAQRTVIRGAADIYKWMQGLGEPLEVEQVWVAGCDSKNRPYDRFLLSQGTLSSSLIHPRDLFAPLIRGRAASFFMVHNHPSGNPTPSIEDIEITRRIKAVADLVSIRFLDHLVMARGAGYTSLQERGLI